MDLPKTSEQALIFETGDIISKIVSEICKKGRHEFLVIENGKHVGIVTDMDVFKRTIDSPEDVKIGHMRNIIKWVDAFSSDTDPSELISFMVSNGFRAVPVKKEGGFGIITNVALLGAVKTDVRGKATDAMVCIPLLNPHDTIGKAHSLMRELHDDKLVIIGKSGKVEGVVDAIDLLKTLYEPKKKMMRGEISGEKTSPGKLKISSTMFIQTDFAKAKPDAALGEIIDIMLSRKTDTVVIEDKKFEGIVTAQNILKVVCKRPVAGNIIVSGMQKEDDFVKSIISKDISDEVAKLGRILPIDRIIIDVKRFEKGAVKVKYSVKARLITEKGFFFAEGHEWDIARAVRSVLAKLEKEALKKAGKEHARPRGITKV